MPVLSQKGIVHILLLVVLVGAAIGIAALNNFSPNFLTRNNDKVRALTSQPNVVVIITDDQDTDSLPVMRKLMAYPEGSWVKFNNAFANQSLCCPARVSLLTGQYAYIHGIYKNELASSFNDTNALPVWLHNAGYQTKLLGKYLNQFPWGRGSTYVPPGWDFFKHPGPGVDLSSQQAADFIKSATTPFFLYLSYTDPHAPANPPTRYVDADVYIPPDRPNFNETDVTDKQSFVKTQPLMDQTQIDTWHNERIASQRELLAVDDGIQQVVDALKVSGKLDNTMIIFLADHGFSWGSHRYTSKNCAYEECNAIPLLIRYPGLGANREENRLVSMVDLNATITEFAGVTPGLPSNGRSLIPLITNTATNWDDTVLIESLEKYFGIRVPGWKYVEYPSSKKELYDLSADPYELQNIAGQSAHAVKQAELAGRLQTLKGTVPSPSPSPSSSPSTQAPSVSITGLSNNPLVKGTKAVKITVLDSQDVGVGSIELLVDGNVVGSTTIYPYTISWNTKLVADGSRSLTAKWYDPAGNVITSSPVSVTVDNTLPTVSVTTPVVNQIVSGTVPISASASDASGIKTIKFFVDGVLITTVTTGTFEYNWDSTLVANGKRNLRVTATDKAGNNGSVNISVTVQN